MLNALQLDARSKGMRVSIADIKGLQHLTITAGSSDQTPQMRAPRPTPAVGSLTPARRSVELAEGAQASPVHQSALPISVNMAHWTRARDQLVGGAGASAAPLPAGGTGAGAGANPYPGTPQQQQRPSAGGAGTLQVGAPASQLALDSPEFARLVAALLSDRTGDQTEAVRAAADWLFRHSVNEPTAPLLDRIANHRNLTISTSLNG